MNPKAGGFTLIELIVGVSASLIILLGTLHILSLTRIALDSGGNRAEATQNARIALERISRDLRQAEDLLTNLPTTSSDPFLPPPSEIEFQDGHDPESLTYLRYHVLGDSLYREESYYAFPSAPTIRVPHNILDADGNPPVKAIVQDLIVAEGLVVLSFWGENDIHISIEVNRGSARVISSTGVFGRNFTGT